MKRFRRFSRTCMTALLAAVVVTAVPIAERVRAADFSECSAYDDYDSSSVLSSYNISYLCVALFQSQPDNIFFYIYMTNPTRTTMFNDGFGSFAAVLIDTNADDLWDIVLETDDVTYPFGRDFVPASAYINNRYSPCRVDSFMNVPGGGRYVAFRVSHRCINLNPSGWKWKGYVDYKAGDSTGFDYSSGRTRDDGGWWVDFSSFVRGTTTVTTPTTTTTTTTSTTLPIPPKPASVTITALTADSVRVNWSDNSSSEQGFLIQRNDLPVPAGTTVAAWPYKVGPNATEWSVGGLTRGAQICFAIAAFNSSGASEFTDFVCLILPSATTTASTVPSSLTCDGTWGKKSRTSTTLGVTVGAENAGKRLLFEIFTKGDWIKLGMARVRADGVAMLRLGGSTAKLKGSFPIRATQGSRFICEGDVG